MALEGIGGSVGLGSPIGIRQPEGIGPRAPEGAQRGDAKGGFAGALEKALEDLEGVQSVADNKSLALVTGQDVPVHEVMAAVTEAEIATQLTTAVAARAIQAYQEIWRMEI